MVRSSLKDEGDRAQEPKKRRRTKESHNVRKEGGMKGEPREHVDARRSTYGRREPSRNLMKRLLRTALHTYNETWSASNSKAAVSASSSSALKGLSF